MPTEIQWIVVVKGVVKARATSLSEAKARATALMAADSTLKSVTVKRKPQQEEIPA